MKSIWRQPKDYGRGPFGKQRSKNHFWTRFPADSTALFSRCGMIRWGMGLHEKYNSDVPKCKHCLKSLEK